jgi:hypothetical protein
MKRGRNISPQSKKNDLDSHPMKVPVSPSCTSQYVSSRLTDTATISKGSYYT